MLKVELIKNNQYIINDSETEKTMFQSYNSPIIEIDRNNLVITVYPDFCRNSTTGKYRNQFLDSEGFYEIDTLEKLVKAIKDKKAVINETEFKVVKIDRFSRGF